MRSEVKSSVKNSVRRMTFAGLSLIAQVLWLVFIFIKLNQYSTIIAFFTSILSIVLVLAIYSMNTSSEFKTPWIIMIFIFPIFGICVFMLFGRAGATRHVKKVYHIIDEEIVPYIRQDKAILNKLSQEDIEIANTFRYIADYGQYPVYENNSVKYFDDTNDALKAQLNDIAEAEKYIFLEYHAIEDAASFAPLKRLLAKKASEGVEVRILYDDAGSVGFLNPEFIKNMEALNIQCRVFNPIQPVINIFMNNRDHRKITVIDGKIGYTGGYNLADEYFNITHPYGEWKDSGVRIEGSAVKNLAAMFLEMWNVIKRQDYNYGKYIIENKSLSENGGYICPYADSPLDKEPVGENVYLNLIKQAKHYVYFTTPYLIITEVMSRELCCAAKRGVDVRIITPGIPDKKVVYQVTRSYYPQLIKAGVNIYEFMPGFIHEKQCVCDGKAAVVGSINLDFRSLYLHFENAVLMYNCDAVADVKKDIETVLGRCRKITFDSNTKVSRKLSLEQLLLRLISPLM